MENFSSKPAHHRPAPYKPVLRWILEEGPKTIRGICLKQLTKRAYDCIRSDLTPRTIRRDAVLYWLQMYYSRRNQFTLITKNFIVEHRFDEKDDEESFDGDSDDDGESDDESDLSSLDWSCESDDESDLSDVEF